MDRRSGGYDAPVNQNAVSFLLEQHDRIRRLFDEVEHGTGDRSAAFASLVGLLAAHERAEADVVYPALRAIDDAGARIASDRFAEEQQAEQDLAALVRIGVDSPDFELAFKTFRSAVEAHADNEEAEVLPALLKAYEEPRLQAMAAELRGAESPGT